MIPIFQHLFEKVVGDIVRKLLEDEMSDTEQAVYVGPNDRLVGETALIKDDPDDPGMVEAQFDKNPLYVGQDNLGQGWHKFYKRHFNVNAAKQLPPLKKDPPTTGRHLYTDEELEDKGLSRSGHTIMVTCCCCDQKVEFLGDVDNWGEGDDYYCGGSPRCCP